MSISRDELINILSVVSFLGHYEREMHATEKKVLMAMFKAASVTHEEHEKMKSNHSLDGMLKQLQSDDAKHTLVELMALVAGADGVLQDEERTIIKKIILKCFQYFYKRLEILIWLVWMNKRKQKNHKNN